MLQTVDRLKVSVHPDRRALGEAAGAAVAACMRKLPGRVRMVFAAAPSQNETLETLARAMDLDWSRVTAFHMDEYAGLAKDAPQAFSRYLREHLFDLVHPGEIHLIDGLNDPARECGRYAALIKEAPIDIVCLGIGENGHLAFNDPPVADFKDPRGVKEVELDEACRRQQVNDGCFPALDAVPRRAITLTIPALTTAAHLFCSVPGPRKREAVRRTLEGPISPLCPATALRSHPDCTLYLDRDSHGR